VNTVTAGYGTNVNTVTIMGQMTNVSPKTNLLCSTLYKILIYPQVEVMTRKVIQGHCSGRKEIRV